MMQQSLRLFGPSLLRRTRFQLSPAVMSSIFQTRTTTTKTTKTPSELLKAWHPKPPVRHKPKGRVKTAKQRTKRTNTTATPNKRHNRRRFIKPKAPEPKTEEERLLLKHDRKLPKLSKDFQEKIDNKQIQTLPLLQRRELRCLQCAGFIRKRKVHPKEPHRLELLKNGGIRLFRGCRFSRVLTWPDDDIRQFYTRVATAFGVDPFDHKWGKMSHMAYLLRQSLLRTFMNKYKLTSKSKTFYKVGGGDEGLRKKDFGGYPVPNKQRHRRFRDENRVPFKFVCNNKTWKNACRHLDPNLVSIAQNDPVWQERQEQKKAETLKKRAKVQRRAAAKIARKRNR